jgi:aspartyl-tRNA(Asn)/glutamyl-tRNA(Gln) amidotransferase subunit A
LHIVLSKPDLTETRQRIAQGQVSAKEAMQDCLDRAQSADGQNAFLRLYADRSIEQTADPVLATTPLGGLAFSVKDLFDELGQVTTAGSLALADAPPAAADAPVVARLRAAGGVSIGRSHMVEFAFSGVGINPHHPTPRAVDAKGHQGLGWDAQTARIPGGSSSGAAVSVASGAAWIGLGSDTGGSIRIPAAFNGLVGFKPTARCVPTDGAWPLSPTLDSVGALTRSARDAVLVHSILADQAVRLDAKPWSERRLAVVHQPLTNELSAPVASAFWRSVALLRQGGATVVDLELPELDELSGLQANGGFAAAESYAWHRELLASRGHLIDPRVASRMQRGEAIQAWQYLNLQRARQQWIVRVAQSLSGFDAVVSPTVPVTAPAIADVAPGAERDDAFFRLNALLLRNTSVVNLLDGCAISLPCHQPGEAPVGLMLWHCALHDDTVLSVALQAERLLTVGG